MRNEALIGYLLHQRPYQEKRALYSLFSKEHGVIHGVGKKALHYLNRYSCLLRVEKS